jgi:DNA mismatch repair protein MutS2
MQHSVGSNHLQLVEQSLVELEFGKILELIVPFTLTERGAAHVRSIRPTLDREQIATEHAAIAEILQLRARGDDVPLERTDDPEQLVRRSKIVGAYLRASELVSILELLGTSRRVLHFIGERAEQIPHLAALAKGLVENRLLERHIRDAVDTTGALRDDASAELRRIRASIDEVSARLRSKLRRIVQRLGDEDLLQDEFYTQRDGRLVVPLKVEYKRSLSGIIHGISQTGATVFFEPSEVFELNNELAELRSAEEREMIRILQALTAEVGAHAEGILAADRVLTLLDSLRARALFAEHYHCHQPTIVADGTIELRNVYHPLLVVSKGRDHVVPLSVHFDRTQRGYLISGPNAGGKSIAIKTIGVSTAMALAGIYPMGEVTVSPVEVLVAIGDHQSIESNLSTFSSQLVRLRDILQLCTESTLVIVDEICAGTDPSEGSALAAAIIDGVLDRGGYIVATTHQFTLKTYALTRKSLLNASMEFDTTRLEPTYRFLPGVPGNSYALALAAALELPGDVLERARSYVGTEHERIESSIHELQQLRADMEERRTIAARQQLEAEQLRRQYEERFQQFKAKYLQLMEAARHEAAELVRRTKEELRQIRQAASSQQTLDRARSQLQQLEQQIVAQMQQHPPSAGSSQPIEVGDVVELLQTQQRGRVVEITPKHLLVEVGSVRLRVEPHAVRRTERVPNEHVSGTVRPLKLDAPTEIDVRGMRARDAVTVIERALNDAVLGGVLRLTIIHGTGTGQLREAIHAYLEQHPLVASYRVGQAGSTDWGRTYVELR